MNRSLPSTELCRVSTMSSACPAFLPRTVAVVAMLAWLAGCHGDRYADRAHPAVGLSVPPLQLVSLTDSQRPPPPFSGRVTLLNFWGTWCGPCRQELPGLARLAARLVAEPRFQLVAVSCGFDSHDDLLPLAEATRSFLAAQRLDLEVWGDPSGDTRALFATQFGFAAFPSSYLIGPDGRVRAVWQGYRPNDETAIAQAVVAVLKEAPPAPTDRETPGLQTEDPLRP